MKKRFLIAGVALCTFFAACQEENETNQDTPATTSVESSDEPTGLTESPSILDSGITLQAVPPQEQVPQAQIQQATAPAQAGNASAAGLNPPHGEPGHRCDIPVGAPLNTPPATGAGTSPMQTQIERAVPVPAPSSQSPAQLPQQSPAPTNASGSGNVNPAHGQPGHRCDIPVGAPLP